VPSRFAADTAVRRLDDDRFEGRIDSGWWIVRGPNGGYVTAILLRALVERVGPDRSPRSLTVHFTAPPVEGPVVVHTTVEREGRSVTALSARMIQDGRLVAMALAAFAVSRQGVEFADRLMPEVVTPADAQPLPAPPMAPPMVERYEFLQVVGDPPIGGSDRARSGGWIRLSEDRDAPADAVLVAALTDAWIPPVFSRLAVPMAVPTVDLTIHFRRELPLAGAAPDDHLLGVFETTVAAEGFLEEDGEIWAADGTLVAQSRQLALAVPM
jgi:acyl-CoA thioesterase